ncbi:MULTISPECIES: enoyl-CoA hydratase/isomerase family protein [unclassified Variovorax]|uniref:enoyl-CoA hydratase/isomerase family protein n=1 Tax=unclassified Variovorax TaxID=663243 RepID=UPI001BD5226C|nr:MULTISPECIES: enoyl-CoA hydratase/isomerase family protein [unclassified Variovorax]
MPSELNIALRESQLSIDDGIAVFTHLRPAARNALSIELRMDYGDMLGHVEADRSVRALVLTGSGGSFCAGGDLKARQASTDPEFRTADAMRRRIQAGHGWIERLHSLEMPVIAAVDGPAAGAGFSIALAADFILASTRAFFCMSFARVGLIPDLGAFHFLPRAVGLPMARELALTARRVSAAEGKQLGFVHTLHEPDALQAEALRFARRFIAGPREAMGLTKALLNKSFETPYATLAELEANAQAVASTTPYHEAAVAGFLRGEPAAYDWDRTRE